ncbi:metallopeptidase MepB [Colletotrichum sublineola]|nr:metallopeptidase MepB [Colletotrichum sublineola]
MSAQPAKPPQAPPAFSATPLSILQDTRRLLDHLRSVRDRIIQTVQPDGATCSNVILPLVHAENTVAGEFHVIDFYRSVSPDPQLREASREAQSLFNDFKITMATDDAMFKLVDAVLQKNEGIGEEALRLLRKKHKDHVRNGLSLPQGPLRERFMVIQSQLSRLTAEFRKNLAESTGEIWLSAQDLAGVPERFISTMEKGQGENDGKILLSLASPNFYPILRFAKNAEARKRIYIAGDNRCNQNVPLFREIVILRDEAARLLGYSNHAAFRLDEKMAKTPEAVNAFLSGLRSSLADGGRQETEALRQLKKADVESRGEVFDGRYFVWDHSFYNRLMLEKQYSVDHLKISEYFPLQTVVSEMLSMFERMFGLAFVETNGSSSSISEHVSVWHAEVQLLEVWNDKSQGGDFLGYLYLDLFPRTGKYKYAANFNVVPGFTREDGSRQYPATALVCNFSKPTPDNPSLLRHDEVVTLFHELGHGIHDIVSKTAYACFHGTETVLDFGEAPSQMLENWCWMSSPLKLLARHYSSLSPAYLKSWQEAGNEGRPPPPSQMPDDMIESLTKAKHVNGALFHLNQLAIGIFDMVVHGPETHAAIEAMNISKTYNTIRRDIFPPESPVALGEGDEWGHAQARLGHLVEDYDAGYYSYLFSKVYSADMFHTVFRAAPMDSNEGLRYRYAVLEKGGSRDEMQMLTEFLGREPTVDAFQRELGLR